MTALVLLLLTAEPTAMQLYADGVKLYNVGEYDQAIDAFKRAYLISSGPELLFNIAQAYREKGACAEAVKFYKTYLRSAPGAKDRVKVEGRIKSLEPCPEVEAPKVEPATAPPPLPATAPAPVPAIVEAAPPPPTSHSSAGVGLAISGGLFLIAGGVFTGVGAAEAQTQRSGFSAQADQLGHLSNVLAVTGYALGAALAVAGLLLALLSR